LAKTIEAPGRSEQVYDVAFSSDGQLLASSARDNTARISNVATGAEVLSIPHDELDVVCVAFSPDDRILATATRVHGSVSMVRLWNATSGALIKSITALPEGDDGVTRLVFSPDGKMMATGSDGDNAAKLWDVSEFAAASNTGSDDVDGSTSAEGSSTTATTAASASNALSAPWLLAAALFIDSVTHLSATEG